MHSFLITGGTKESRLKQVNQMLVGRGVGGNLADKFTIGNLNEPGPITIDAIRQAIRWTSQYSNSKRGLLIYEAQGLTEPAQQALLKTIEEPEKGTVVILTADSEISLLPTIRSRCKIIRLLTDKPKQAIPNASFVTGLAVLPRPERILFLYKKISDMTNKTISPHFGSIKSPEALALISEIIDSAYQNIHKQNNFNQKLLGKILLMAATSYRRIQQNMNPTLVLQQFALDIPPNR